MEMKSLKSALRLARALGAMLFLVCLAAESRASHYRFWLHGKIRFPFAVAAPDTVGGSDCWGWTAPDGTEYALMGVRDGIAVVNAHTLQVKGIVPGPTLNGAYYWRDVETYRHYAYAVSELTGTNQGLSVIDLQYLPDSVHFVGSFPLNAGGAVTAHTIAIDTLKGFAYCERNSTQPVVIFNLANPENPVFAGVLGTPGSSIHDMFARNDTVFVAEGFAGTWSVWNAANKASPALIARVSFPGAGYMHSAWPSENRQLLITTEEVPAGKTMKVWDVSNLSSILLRGQYIGASQIPHNPYVKGNLVFVSHYEAGVTVVDISSPNAPVEVARYDTYPASDSAEYRGCWSTYPFSANGFVYASNLDGWLFVLRFGQNSMPQLAPLGTANVAEGTTTVLPVSSSDADSLDRPGLQLLGAPAWVVLFDSGNGGGKLTLTPGYSDSGMVTFKLIATDGFEADTETVMIRVANVNRAPVLNAAGTHAMAGGDTLNLHLVSADPDLETITLSASGLKPYIAFVDSGNGRGSLTFTPSIFVTGTDTVVIGASDGSSSDTAAAIVAIRGQVAIKGDLNFDGLLTSSDAVLELNCVFLGVGNCFSETADVNCDGLLTSVDVVLQLNAVFLGQPLGC
jgi:choice-of-anchor B domain-containing protein